MKKLFLFTNSFPYGKGEKSFIEPELVYLKKHFDITIFSNATREQVCDKEQMTELDKDISTIVLNNKLNVKERIFYTLKCLSSALLWKEFFLLLKNKRSIKKNWYSILYYYSHAINIKNQLEKLGIFDKDNAIFYTYWNDYCTLGILLAKRKHKDIKVITRTHGYDLYNERCRGNWQPFKYYMTKNINAIFFVSIKGKEYYINNFINTKKEIEKLYIARLGVFAKKNKNMKSNNGTFELLSCSNVIPLKRVELIIEALAICKDNMKIHWTHFGDGDSMNHVKRLAREKLLESNNIKYTFCGHVSHEKLMKYYVLHPVDCFITTSSTEGCPVSIQEAISYGIPIIGTDVGGISELIMENGILLPSNPSVNEIADAIKEIYYASEEQIQVWRKNSYKLWMDKYDSDKNYNEFVKQILKLLE